MSIVGDCRNGRECSYTSPRETRGGTLIRLPLISEATANCLSAIKPAMLIFRKRGSSESRTALWFSTNSISLSTTYTHSSLSNKLPPKLQRLTRGNVNKVQHPTRYRYSSRPLRDSRYRRDYPLPESRTASVG